MMQKKKLILHKVKLAYHKKEVKTKLLRFNSILKVPYKTTKKTNKISVVNIKIINITYIQAINKKNKQIKMQKKKFLKLNILFMFLN